MPEDVADNATPLGVEMAYEMLLLSRRVHFGRPTTPDLAFNLFQQPLRRFNCPSRFWARAVELLLTATALKWPRRVNSSEGRHPTHFTLQQIAIP